jgi:hypothetical protein
VVLGPDRPALNTHARPLASPLDFAEVIDPADDAATDALLSRLARDKGARARVRSATRGVDVTLLEGDGVAPVLFAVRRANEPVTARIERDEGAPALIDALTGEPVDPEALPLGPYQVRMLVAAGAEADVRGRS